MLALRSLLFALGMLLSLLVIAPLGMLTWPISFESRFRVISQWARFNVWWLEKCCGVHYQITGVETWLVLLFVKSSGR